MKNIADVFDIVVFYYKPTDMILEGYLEKRETTFMGPHTILDERFYRLYHPDLSVATVLAVTNGKLPEDGNFTLLGKL